jgi:hypothetical protein
MQAPTQSSPTTFHMRLVEPLSVVVISVFGIALAVGLFWIGVGDLIKTILLLVISMYGAFVGLTMTRKLEIAGSELIISPLVSKRVIAREDINAYFMDEQGINRRTRAFVTIHLANGRRFKFKGIKEGNHSLLQALESFTGLKPAEDSPEEPAKPDL